MTNIELVDYLPTGMTLSIADTNGWSAATATTLINTYIGTLAAGASDIVEVLVSTDASIDPTGVINAAEIASFTDTNGIVRSGDDIDSTPDADPSNDGFAEDDSIDNTNGDEDDSDFASIVFGMCEDVVVSGSQTICLGDTVPLTATLGQDGVVYAWSPAAGLSCTDCPNPMASPSTTTNYQVTATYAACTSTADVTVEVLAPITVTETIMNYTCCDAGSINLSISGGSGSYTSTWSDNTLSGLDVTGLLAGTYTVTIVDDNSSCTDIQTYTINDDCMCTDLVAEDIITIPADDPTELCLPFTFQESQNIYEVLLGGTGFVQPVDGCNVDSVFTYSYSQVIDQGNSGPYRLDFWTCSNGVVYGGVTFQDINELVDSMNVWDPVGSWIDMTSIFTISGGVSNSSYGDMEITHLASNISAYINFNSTGIAQGQVYDVPDTPGTYEYTITNTAECCTDVVTVIVEEPEAITPDYTSYFTEVNNPVFLCVNTNELATSPISLDFCEEPVNGQVIFDTGNECLTYIPDPSYVGLDSFCVVVCDESGICDTTFVDITIADEPHVLLDTTLIVCQAPVNGTLISDGDSDCYEYIPDMDYCGQDSICLITCSELDVCGTITIFIDVACGTPMPTIDTVYASVLVNTILEDACVPLDELNGAFDTLYLCGDASNGSVALNNTDQCVDYTPDLNYLGPDEFCVVVCDSLMFCDTTYFIIDVVGDPCDTTTTEVLSIEADDCDSPAVLCLPFDVAEIPDYVVTLGGDQYTDGFVGCDFDTTFSYNYFTIPGQGNSGPYVMDQWIIDGQAFSGNFVDPADLVALMNSFDMTSTWTLDAANFRIRGGNPNTDYGNIDISQPATMGTAVLQFNENLVANKAGLLLPVGEHDVRVTHVSGCPIYQYELTVTCNPILIDTIPYTIELGDTLIVCPEELGILDPITGVFNNCPTSAGNQVSVNIDPVTGCVEMIGLVIGDNDEACIEICTIDSCAQFVFLLEVIPTCPDIFDQDSLLLTTINCNAEESVCLSIPITEIDTYSIEIDGVSYTGSTNACTDGTAISLPIGEHIVTAIDPLTNCMDDLFVNIVCISPDTIYDSIATLDMDSVCISLDELVGTAVSIDNFCPESSGEHVVFSIDQSTNCVTYTGLIPGIDTACIVVCDDLGICDTTYIIVDVSDDFGTPPVAVSDVDTTFINTGFEVNISLNDSIPGGIDTLYVLDEPSNGIVVLSSNNMLTYTPDSDYCDSETPDEFSYVVCNEFGCDTATVEIFVLCEDLIFYSGFSPNGDGINDQFIIQGVENYLDHELAIYNRWGNQVLFTKNYRNDWEGTWEEAPLPDGTYFYVFDDGLGNIYSGYVQINR